MTHQSSYKNNKKILRKTKKLYYQSIQSPQRLRAMKALEFQIKLNSHIAQSQAQDPIEQIKLLDLDDLPIELVKRWIIQSEQTIPQ